jgi:hypothetical protein
MGEMSILDDAIREHLELKRAHGADESELKRLEDEAFGPAERPDGAADQVDPFAEAPTEFLATPQDTSATASPPSGRKLPNIADLQEPPPPKPVEPEENAEDAAAEGPSEEEHPAMEHRTIAEPASEDRPAPPSDELQPDPEAPQTGEHEAIAEQPTQLFDVEGQFEDTAETASPTDEELVDAERSEPRLSPLDPLADIDDSDREIEASGPASDEPEDEFDEFFSEQRLSDELNQALEAPLPDEPGTLEEPEDLAEYDLPEGSTEQDLPERPRDEADESEAADEYKAEPGHADALEDTPEFLEESPEDDDAWFEQRPPKDFDFGD